MIAFMIMFTAGLACLVLFMLEAIFEHNEYRHSAYHSYQAKQHKRNRNQYVLLATLGLILVVTNAVLMIKEFV